MKRWTMVFGLVLASLLGCGPGDPGKRSEPVSVEGKVILADGKPAANVMVRLSPASSDAMAAGGKTAADGKFATTAIPGEYIFYVEPVAGREAAHKAIPAKYHTPDFANKVQIAGCQPFEIKLEPR